MPLLPRADPLLCVAVVLMAGVLFGALARLARLPGITGQVLVGVLIGRYGLHLFDEQAVHGLTPITHFALGLVAVSVGAHLNFRRLRNAGARLGLLLAAEVLITPALVFLAVLWAPGVDWSTGLLLATIAISTAPATVVALVKEARARGVFVKTLVGAVALNNIACIFLFELARDVAALELGADTPRGAASWLLEPSLAVLQSLALGALAAGVMHAVLRFQPRAELLATLSVLTILLTTGLSDYLGISPLLSCLFLGVVQTNLTSDREKLVDSVFSNFEPAILAIFFTLAGMHLSFEDAGHAGLVALLFFSARLVGKLTSARLAMRLAAAPAKVRRYLGDALVPQAGVAVGLVILIRDDPLIPEGLSNLLVAVVLTAVTASEIVGPILTRRALVRAGEAGMDRSRLLDFLQEENIAVDLDASGVEQAIERLVDLMIHSHHLTDVPRDELLRSVLTREGQASTCLGGGLAVPHGILPAGHPMVGVMGLSRRGLPFKTPDGRPVHCMVLFATSEHERDRHLQVLASLARTVGSDVEFQTLLYNATSPAHAYDVLHGDRSESFNYFLEK